MGLPIGTTRPGGADERGPLFEQWAPRPRWRSRLRAAAVGLVVCLLAGLVAAAVLLVHVERVVDSNLERFDAFSGVEDRPPRPAGAARGALNLLVIGTDRRSDVPTTGTAATGEPWVPGAQRSDALMLVHVDADRDGAAVISIPRDAWVEVPGHGRTKINAAFSYGGAPLTVETVERLTDVRIDHVAIADWAGFTELTDAVGGVEVTVPEATYDTEQQIHWAAGRHRLTGDQALAYVRQRKGLPGGDLDRVRRQQLFIRALASDALRTAREGGPLAALEIIDDATRHVAVDEGWSTSAMGQLVLSLRGLDQDDVNVLTAPVSGTGTVGGQSVVHLDRSLGAQMWAQVRADRVERWTARHPDGVTGDVVR